MKKTLCFIFLALFLMACSDVKDNKAEQSNQFNKKNFEENSKKRNDRIKEKIEEFYTKLNLSKEKEKKIDEILKTFNKSMRELMEEGQKPDREKLKYLISERDEKIKLILNEEEYENYIDNVEFLIQKKDSREKKKE